jgi:methylthioxylose transferase
VRAVDAHAGSLAGGRSRAGSARELLPHGVAAGCALTIGVGLAVHASGTTLGAGLPPFNASWDPDVAPHVVAAVAAVVVAVLAGPHLLGRPRSPVGFAGVALGVGLVLRLALGASRDGTERWSAVFGSDVEAANEYLPALVALDPGLVRFLDRFAEVALTLPIHPSAHPPGVLVTMHWLGIDGAGGAAALAILGGALTVPLAYVLARQLLDERRARVAALLVMLAPSTLLYGATSFDALFAALGTLAAALLVSRRRIARAVGGPALAIGSFFSFALLGVGAWAVFVAAKRRSVRQALHLAAWCAVAVSASYLLLYAATGFDPVGAVRAAADAYAVGISGARPLAFWLFGSPVAFLVAMGLPLAWYALRALGQGDTAAVALAVVVVIAVLLGFTKGETERIWLFMVPLAAVAAASVIPLDRLRPVLGALAVQALAVELLLWTIW